MSLATSVRKLTAERARTLRPRRVRGAGGDGEVTRRKFYRKHERPARAPAVRRATTEASDRLARSARLLAALLGLVLLGSPSFSLLGGRGLLRLLGLLLGLLLLGGLLLLLLRLGLGILRGLGLGGRDGLALDQLEDRHLRPVPRPRAQLDDAQIAARPVGKARRDVVEDLLDEIALQDPAQHPAAVVQRAVLAAGDHPLGDRPQLLGLRKGRDDPLGDDERLELVAEQGLAMGGGPAQLSPFDSVTHDLLLRPKPRPDPARPCRGRDRACPGPPGPLRATSCRSSWSPACPSRCGAPDRGAYGCWRS